MKSVFAASSPTFFLNNALIADDKPYPSEEYPNSFDRNLCWDVIFVCTNPGHTFIVFIFDFDSFLDKARACKICANFELGYWKKNGLLLLIGWLAKGELPDPNGMMSSVPSDSQCADDDICMILGFWFFDFCNNGVSFSVSRKCDR